MDPHSCRVHDCVEYYSLFVLSYGVCMFVRLRSDVHVAYHIMHNLDTLRCDIPH
jgi:hypothetical protein